MNFKIIPVYKMNPSHYFEVPLVKTCRVANDLMLEAKLLPLLIDFVNIKNLFKKYFKGFQTGCSAKTSNEFSFLPHLFMKLPSALFFNIK